MTHVITRFPPSPTGHAHIGSYRTAIFNYLFAKKHGGSFLLRIEDTDKARSKQEYQEGIIQSMHWLGLTYDSLTIQTEQVATHAEAIQKLISAGKAYVSKEEAKDGSGVIKEVVRFKNPNKVVTFTDLILGDISVDTTDLGDFVIARSITDPLYHLAVVVDDTTSGVTHVIRGVDHISNTPRQILIIEALGFPIPIYAHIPLVLGEDKQKLSKRKGALSVMEYQKKGYLPSAILNCATFIGFNPGGEKEIYSLDELVELFDISKVQKGGAVFNPVKLDWFNQEHIKLLDTDTYLSEAKKFVPQTVRDTCLDTKLDKILLASKSRITYFSEFDAMTTSPEYTCMYQPISVAKEMLLVPEKLRKGREVTDVHIQEILSECVKLLAQAPENVFDSVESIKEILWGYAEEQGRGIVLWPLRIALTGQEKSVDPFSMIYILGKEEAIQRIQAVL